MKSMQKLIYTNRFRLENQCGSYVCKCLKSVSLIPCSSTRDPDTPKALWDLSITLSYSAILATKQQLFWLLIMQTTAFQHKQCTFVAASRHAVFLDNVGVDLEKLGDLTDHYFKIQNHCYFKKKMARAKSKEKTRGIASINILTSESWYFYGSHCFPGNTFGKIFNSN